MPSIPRTPGIYKITCSPTGKFYVGSTQDIHGRWQIHRRRLIAGKHENARLQNAWNKYGGDSFSFDIIECVPVPQLLAREQFYLDTLRPYDNAIGFNIARDASAPMRGRIGIVKSEATRAKLSASNKGRKPSEATLQRLRGRKRSEETRQAIANAKRNPSAETRQRISDAARRRPPVSPEAKMKMSRAQATRPPISEETRQIMSEAQRKWQFYPRHIVTTPEGVELLVHLPTFCEERGLSYNCMTHIVMGLQKSHKGYTVRRATEHRQD